MIYGRRNLQDRFYDIQESINGLVDKNFADYAEIDLTKFDDVLSAQQVTTRAALTDPVAPILRVDENSIYHPPLSIGNGTEYIEIDRVNGVIKFFTGE